MAQLCANEAHHNKTGICDADQFTASEVQTALLSHLYICYFRDLKTIRADANFYLIRR
jgi:hypothetical protein